tara:strand:+ start:1670 stop:2011 length:342 start_codon:yes stop_codon:yes gene_type:complete
MTLIKTWTYPTLERLVAEDGDHTVTKIGWQYEGAEGADVVFSATGTHKLQVPGSDLAIEMNMAHVPFAKVNEATVTAWLDADSQFDRAGIEASVTAVSETITEPSAWTAAEDE